MGFIVEEVSVMHAKINLADGPHEIRYESGSLHIHDVKTWTEAQMMLARLVQSVDATPVKAAAEPQPAEEPPKPKTNGAESKPAAGVNPDGAVPAIPKALKDATRLKDVLVFLQEEGIKDEAGLVKKCEALKEYVPLLKRVADIPERVKRTLMLMNPPAA